MKLSSTTSVITKFGVPNKVQFNYNFPLRSFVTLRFESRVKRADFSTRARTERSQNPLSSDILMQRITISFRAILWTRTNDPVRCGHAANWFVPIHQSPEIPAFFPLPIPLAVQLLISPFLNHPFNLFHSTSQ